MSEPNIEAAIKRLTRVQNCYQHQTIAYTEATAAIQDLTPKHYWITERSSGHYKVQTHSETGSIYTVCECYYAREAERMRDLLEASD